jgi:ubiquinone/menaquinone biosynthesis C-methylase UbiE
MTTLPSTRPSSLLTRLTSKARRAPGLLVKRALTSLFPKWYSKSVCSAEGLWDAYFTDAEQAMAVQWDNIIWPIIKNCDFDTVLELAPGAGRNTERLTEVARVIHAVDLNEYALKRLRERFQSFETKCQLHFHRNEGSDLGMIENSTITLIYCWDAAVHFDKSIIKDYVREFARVLSVNGMGFVHHSNLGDMANVDIRTNPHFRSNMSKELFAEYCNRNGLEIIEQKDLPWTGKESVVDCISVFRRCGEARR